MKRNGEIVRSVILIGALGLVLLLVGCHTLSVDCGDHPLTPILPVELTGTLSGKPGASFLSDDLKPALSLAGKKYDYPCTVKLSNPTKATVNDVRVESIEVGESPTSNIGGGGPLEIVSPDAKLFPLTLGAIPPSGSAEISFVARGFIPGGSIYRITIKFSANGGGSGGTVRIDF